MKRLLTLIMLISALGLSAQNTIDHLGRIRMRYNNSGSIDTTWIYFIGDSVYYYSPTNPFHKFNGGIIVDSIKLNGVWESSFGGSQWTKSGSDIYYNTGNVGINNASPSYKLDVGGLIGGSNIETNTNSLSTKLGFEAGLNENESAERNNTLLGYKAGRALTTQKNNTIVGSSAGLTSTGSANSIFGISGSSISGDYNSIFGYSAAPSATSISYNTSIGTYSGYNLTTGDNNTFVGYYSGAGTTTASGNVSIGYYAGYRETGSNKLFIDNRDRTSEANARVSSLIYGKFDDDTLNQFVDVNGMVYHTAIMAEIYKTGTTVAQSIPTGTTPTKVTAFTTNKYGIHCTADAANDKITITKAGYYDFKLGLSYQIATSGVTFTAHVFVNGVEDVSLHSTGKPTTANDPRSTAVVGTIHVTTVPCDVDYRVTHDNGGSVNISYDYCNMAVNYIGE